MAAYGRLMASKNDNCRKLSKLVISELYKKLPSDGARLLTLFSPFFTLLFKYPPEF